MLAVLHYILYGELPTQKITKPNQFLKLYINDSPNKTFYTSVFYVKSSNVHIQYINFVACYGLDKHVSTDANNGKVTR